MQRLSGASLLVFANKTDVEGCMTEQEILSVSDLDRMASCEGLTELTTLCQGPTIRIDTNTPLAHPPMQRHDRYKPKRRIGLGCRGCQAASIPILSDHFVHHMFLSERVTFVERVLSADSTGSIKPQRWLKVSFFSQGCGTSRYTRQRAVDVCFAVVGPPSREEKMWLFMLQKMDMDREHAMRKGN